MFDSANIANRMQNDMAKIKLDNTIDYAKIQADIAKKMSKFQGGGYNQAVQNVTAPMGQYVPPAAYQSQYCMNYNWQQPNVQNAYASVQNYTPMTASFDSSQVQSASYMPQPMTHNAAVQGGSAQTGTVQTGSIQTGAAPTPVPIYTPGATGQGYTQGQTANGTQANLQMGYTEGQDMTGMGTIPQEQQAAAGGIQSQANGTSALNSANSQAF